MNIKDTLLGRIYNNQRSNSKLRGHDMPSYNLEEFRVWARADKRFNKIFKEWVASGFEPNKVPSFDRFDNDEGYSFCNISCTTWEENRAGGGRKRIPVLCKANGVLMSVYDSAKSAAKAVNCHSTEITATCRGRRKLTRGYEWEYAMDYIDNGLIADELFRSVCD
jgi:hypothetical protein